MFVTFTRCVAVTLSLWPALTSAQGYYAPRIKLLADVDVLDAFPIGDVVLCIVVLGCRQMRKP